MPHGGNFSTDMPNGWIEAFVMLLLNLILGFSGLFLSGYSFGQWRNGKGRKYLTMALFEGLAGVFFTVAAIGCAT